MPSDTLVSRCYRELDKRLLYAFNVWTVKNLMCQVTATRKKKKVGTDLYVYEEEPEVSPAGHYTDWLHTYLLALAVAGASKAPDAPSQTKTFGCDPTKYVSVPWDVLEAYYFRAVRASRHLPEDMRASWAEKLDTAERAMWVSEFREGTRTLGQVVS